MNADVIVYSQSTCLLANGREGKRKDDDVLRFIASFCYVVLYMFCFPRISLLPVDRVIPPKGNALMGTKKR